MEKKYLGYQGLQDVAGHVNTRLKTVTTIPASADDGAVRLYVGETGVTYKKGHIYQYNATDLEWVDITSSSEYTAGNGIDITDDEISVETYIFTGTQAQWDALTTEQKKEYDICNITDDASSDDEIYTKSEIDAILDTDYQKKDLETAIEGETTVIGALGALDTKEKDDVKNVYKVMGKNGAKNLNTYPYQDTTRTTNGITFTDLGDGTIKANGTATADAYFSCHSRAQGEKNDLIIPNGRYILSGCPSGGGTTTYNMMAQRTYNGSVDLLGRDSGDGILFVANGDDFSANEVNIQINIFIKNGQTVSNLIFKPMLRYAEDTDNTYVSYAPTNTKLNEEKMSYADNGILGAKNLLPNNATSQTINGVTFTANSDGSVTVNGTATANISTYFISTSISLKAGKYLISGTPNSIFSKDSTGIRISNNDYSINVYGDEDGTLFILNNDTSGLRVDIRIESGTTISNLTFYPMIRLASDPDSTYQLYAMTNREITKKLTLKSTTFNVETDSYGNGIISLTNDKVIVSAISVDTIVIPLLSSNNNRLYGNYRDPNSFNARSNQIISTTIYYYDLNN